VDHHQPLAPRHARRISAALRSPRRHAAGPVSMDDLRRRRVGHAGRFRDGGAKSERVHGLVLAVTPNDGEAIVRPRCLRFDAGDDDAVPYRSSCPSRHTASRQHDDATVDTSTEPWTLHNVKVSTTQTLTNEPGILRRVVPLQIGDEIPDTPFSDQTGRPFRFSDLRGQDAVLAFVYTAVRIRACAR